jgi:hypothetical protein
MALSKSASSSGVMSPLFPVSVVSDTFRPNMQGLLGLLDLQKTTQVAVH